MGGLGSGRYSGKSTTSEYRRIDVRRWQRDGLLESSEAFRWQWSHNGEVVAWISVRAQDGCVNLTYRHRSHSHDWKTEDYPVLLEWTPCNFGGKRAWFICPVVGCGRRVAILYGGGIFACRHCYQLTYNSQNEPPHSRALGRTQAIRMKLGGSPSLLEDFPAKPKGMHWSTYNRLRLRAEENESRSWSPWVLKMMATNAQTT